jgi:predicted metal-dependent phosphoesterase TrpH
VTGAVSSGLEPAVRSFADLHCHSSASFDSLSNPTSLIRQARRFGLTHLAITDHERIDGALRARDLAATRGPADDGGAALTVIVGEEVRTTEGDMIGLFLERAVAPGRTPIETAAAIHEQGGLAGIPHPFDRFRSSGARLAQAAGLAELVRAVDFIEIYNARAMGKANERAAELARDEGIPGVASSDAHSPFEVGVAYTVLPGHIGSADDLRRLLPQASLVMGRASYVVRLLTPVAKLVNRGRGNTRISAASFDAGAAP